MFLPFLFFSFRQWLHRYRFFCEAYLGIDTDLKEGDGGLGRFIIAACFLSCHVVFIIRLAYKDLCSHFLPFISTSYVCIQAPLHLREQTGGTICFLDVGGGVAGYDGGDVDANDSNDDDD